MNEDIMTNEMTEEVNETVNEVEAYEPELIPEVTEEQESDDFSKFIGGLLIGGAAIALFASRHKIKEWNEKRKAKKLATTIAALESAGYAVTKADEEIVDDAEVVEDEIEENVPEETEDEE